MYYVRVYLGVLHTRKSAVKELKIRYERKHKHSYKQGNQKEYQYRIIFMFIVHSAK